MSPTKILVIAKAPVAGRVKTRLCPPCTPQEAARIAKAALLDTLDAASAVTGAELVVVLDGKPGAWLPDGLPVLPQGGGGLDERIDAAFGAAGAPAVLIGMDTPQVTSSVLERACDTLAQPGTDAVLGDAHDGGWWIAGLKRSVPEAFAGVPMSTPYTASAQRLRFRQLGLATADMGTLRDFDTFADAVAVSHQIPGSRFTATVAGVGRRIRSDPDGTLAEVNA